MKHSPGPWSYWPDVAYPTGVITRDETAGHIAVPSNCLERTKANALLLAAAPELLEALEECDRVFSKFCPDPMSAYGMAWGEVQTAIAKAKGEA